MFHNEISITVTFQYDLPSQKALPRQTPKVHSNTIRAMLSPPDTKPNRHNGKTPQILPYINENFYTAKGSLKLKIVLMEIFEAYTRLIIIIYRVGQKIDL